MAKQKYFISQKQIKEIVKYYGTFRKWELNSKIKQESTIIHLRAKTNDHLWMVIARKDDAIEVHFSDNKGYIVKRDRWIVSDGKQLVIIKA